jgi:hypothetical protein
MAKTREDELNEQEQQYAQLPFGELWTRLKALDPTAERMGSTKERVKISLLAKEFPEFYEESGGGGFTAINRTSPN